MDMFKIAVIGICGGAVCVVLRWSKSEFCIPVSIATGIIILYFLFGYIENINSEITQLAAFYSIDIFYIKTVFKVICIAYICAFACDLLKDANLGSIAFKVDMAGRLIIFMHAIPIARALLQAAEKILKNV